MLSHGYYVCLVRGAAYHCPNWLQMSDGMEVCVSTQLRCREKWIGCFEAGLEEGFAKFNVSHGWSVDFVLGLALEEREREDARCPNKRLLRCVCQRSGNLVKKRTSGSWRDWSKPLLVSLFPRSQCQQGMRSAGLVSGQTSRVRSREAERRVYIS